MDILGSIGNLYTFILLVVLFLGSGLAVWAGISALMNSKDSRKESTDKMKENIASKLQKIKNNNLFGGINMKNSGFIKLAVFAFVGIIISAAILTALPNYSSNMNSMNTNSQYSTTAMNMSGTYDQSNMQGMSTYSMQGTTSTSSDLYSIEQQLNYMQQQIYQLQYQMNSLNSSSNMSNSSMNNSNMSNSSTSNSSMSNSSGSSSNSNSSSMSSMPMM